ncbi:MAG TPA: hypothetical protein VI653_22050 [Steroidobacteraceae bacterium]
MGPDFWTRQFAQFIFSIASHGAAVLVSSLGITVFGLGPLGRAVAARIRGRHAADDSLEALGTGITELQDRLDFSERVLTELRQQLIAGGKPSEAAPPRRMATPK